MNKLLFVLAALFLVQNLSSQNLATQYVDWPADNATVFGQGAWVEHQGELTVPLGDFELVLDGLTKALDPSSIQVELPDAWRLVGSQFKVGIRPDTVAEVELLLAEAQVNMDGIQATLDMREALHSVYAEELSMLQANRQLSHQETLLVQDISEAADFWRQRIRELKYKQLELKGEMDALNQQLSELRAEMQEQRERLNQHTGQIRLRIHPELIGNGTVSIRYLTQAASWRPDYDVSITADGAIAFDRFASVAQTTGGPWDQIDLEFVVGNPLSSLAPPPYERWVLKERAQLSSSIAGSYEMNGQVRMDDMEVRTSMWSMSDESDSFKRSAGLFSSDRFRFEPALPPYVGSNGQAERVFIESFELQGELSYLLLPYASDEAYQLATSATWATSRLMPGRVQVEAGGAFRGWFDLILPAPGDTLLIPIGQDPEVRCSRERLADHCSTSALGGKRKSEQTWVIEVENQHNRSITARLEERIPMAYRSDITVELIEAAGGKYDAQDGKLSWNFQLAPGELRKFTIQYRIEYPKNLGISNF